MVWQQPVAIDPETGLARRQQYKLCHFEIEIYGFVGSKNAILVAEIGGVVREPLTGSCQQDAGTKKLILHSHIFSHAAHHFRNLTTLQIFNYFDSNIRFHLRSQHQEQINITEQNTSAFAFEQ